MNHNQTPNIALWDNGDGHHADCMSIAAPAVVVIGLAAVAFIRLIRGHQ